MSGEKGAGEDEEAPLFFIEFSTGAEDKVFLSRALPLLERRTRSFFRELYHF
jgi:hypothetical protein